MLAGQLALTTAALFAGAAFYVSFVEQPARLLLEDRSLLTEWKPSYKYGATMQATLAAVSTLLGLWAWQQTHDWRWALGAALIFANWPYTLLVIRPTNDQIDATPLESANASSRALIVKWGALHAVRTALGLAAVAAYLWASFP